MSSINLQEVFDASLDQPDISAASRSLRNEAMVSFNETGFPSRKHENWRYTDLKPIVSGGFDPSPQPINSQQEKKATQDIEKSILDSKALRLVFINGQLSTNNTFPNEVDGLSISKKTESYKSIDVLQGKELFKDYPLAALNTAFSQRETLITLDEGIQITKPLHLIHINSGTEPRAIQPKIAIDIGTESELTIVQHFISSNPEPGWTNSVTLINQNKGSLLKLYRFQEYHHEQFHTELLKSRLSNNAELKLGYVDLGGKLVRNDVHIDLAEPGAACSIDGVFLAMNGQHIDNHTLIEHSAPRTTSQESFRGIIGEHGRGVFKGKVVVHRDAQGADAQQSSDNLLLSEHGEIDAKPELEIYTDDVKCSHGATVGELDLEQLFYLCSRGVDETTAKGLLTFAFANTILQRIEVPEVRKRAASSIAGELPDYQNWGGLL